MKRVIALLICLVIFVTGCAEQMPSPAATPVVDSTGSLDDSGVINNGNSELTESNDPIFIEDNEGSKDLAEPEDENNSDSDGIENINDEEIALKFAGLDDPTLLQYVQDNIYADLSSQFAADDYTIESIATSYVSKEYLEELEYNSRKNIYFGYTLEELDKQFDGQRYVFTLGDDGTTVVKAFEAYDDTYDKVIKNVAIGTGVILVCVTVSVVTGGAGAPTAVSMVFAASAKTGTVMALSSGAISGAAAAITTGFKTRDFDESLKAAAMAGSESFKWGAISGAILGGATKAAELYKSASTIPTPRESELKVLERTKNASEQVSFIDGKEVPLNTPGATRPDVVVRNADGTVKAIEVKNYNLQSPNCRNELYKELERQVTSRATNLPKGSTQEIVLDVRGRGFSDELIDAVSTHIKERCATVYKDIPIQILRY